MTFRQEAQNCKRSSIPSHPALGCEYMKVEDQGSRFGASDYLIVLNFFIGKGNNNTGLFFFQDITEIRKDSNHDRVQSQVTMASNLLGLSGLCTCGY